MACDMMFECDHGEMHVFMIPGYIRYMKTSSKCGKTCFKVDDVCTVKSKH